MDVLIQPTKAVALDLAARLMETAVRENPRCVLGLATGRTMEQLYARLVRFHHEAELDFSLVRTFNLDEYIGLAADDAGSYRYYMNRHLFDHVNIDKRNTHVPDGMASDIDAACDAYEARIDRAGGIDLQLLGIGRAGHIGFNEPLSAFESRTRAVVLTPLTISENEGEFDDPARMPRRAMTMGVETILEAERLLLVATGESKAAVLAQAIEGPLTCMVSASAIQLHPHVTVVCDSAAATRLQNRTYYDSVWETDPAWAPYR